MAVASSLQPPGDGVEAFSVSLRFPMTEEVWERLETAEKLGRTKVQVDLMDEVAAFEIQDPAILAGNLVGIVKMFFTKNPQTCLRSVTITAQTEFMSGLVAQALIVH